MLKKQDGCRRSVKILFHKIALKLLTFCHLTNPFKKIQYGRYDSVTMPIK